jgi:hypothetical protein
LSFTLAQLTLSGIAFPDKDCRIDTGQLSNHVALKTAKNRNTFSAGARAHVCRDGDTFWFEKAHDAARVRQRYFTKNGMDGMIMLAHNIIHFMKSSSIIHSAGGANRRT